MERKGKERKEATNHHIFYGHSIRIETLLFCHSVGIPTRPVRHQFLLFLKVQITFYSNELQHGAATRNVFTRKDQIPQFPRQESKTNGTVPQYQMERSRPLHGVERGCRVKSSRVESSRVQSSPLDQRSIVQSFPLQYHVPTQNSELETIVEKTPKY